MMTKLFVMLGFSIQLFLCIRWDVFGVTWRILKDLGQAPDSVIIVGLFIVFIKFILAGIPLAIIMWFVQLFEEVKKGK